MHFFLFQKEKSSKKEVGKHAAWPQTASRTPLLCRKDIRITRGKFRFKGVPPQKHTYPSGGFCPDGVRLVCFEFCFPTGRKFLLIKVIFLKEILTAIPTNHLAFMPIRRDARRFAWWGRRRTARPSNRIRSFVNRKFRISWFRVQVQPICRATVFSESENALATQLMGAKAVERHARLLLFLPFSFKQRKR